MSTSMPSQPFLNPDVYLNHLQPEGAYNYEISMDVTFVILGVSQLLVGDLLADSRTHSSRYGIFLFI
jgi:hypothetical protein